MGNPLDVPNQGNDPQFALMHLYPSKVFFKKIITNHFLQISAFQ